MKHILNYNITELKEKLAIICQKQFRVNQVLLWIFKRYTIDFEKMTNISKENQILLSNNFSNELPKVLDVKKSVDGTTKFLISLSDDAVIEMVYMPSEKKTSLCISTQVGCMKGCVFCATARLGLLRNISQDELLAQIFLTYQYFPNKRITNLVLMGMGEPLDNFENIISFLDIVQSNEGLSFSGRRITISTCGVVPRIYQLADLRIKVKLAVSLNSAINEERNKIMPINLKYNLNELKASLLYFRKKTNFRITFEYVMIANFNMNKADIIALKKFCGDISCKLNLIKWNEVQYLDWKAPNDEEINSFIE